MSAKDGTEVDRAGFTGSAGTDGHDDIGGEREIVPRLAVIALGGDAFPRQKREGARMDITGRLAAGADGMPTHRSQMVEGRFGENRTAGVAGTEEEDVHGQDFACVGEIGGSSASAQDDAARRSTHFPGFPEQHSSVR